MSARKVRKDRTQVVSQWFEIEVVDGVTRTTAYPDNQEIEKMIARKEQATGRPVELVYRRMNFIDGVPREYAWTTGDPLKRQFGGMCVQRLRVDDWRKHIRDEVAGHLLRSEFNMPRPESRGGCDCEACRAMAARIQQRGY